MLRVSARRYISIGLPLYDVSGDDYCVLMARPIGRIA